MNYFQFLKPIYIFIGISALTTTLHSQNKDKASSVDAPQAFKHSERNAFIENKGQLFDQNHQPNSACLYLYASDSMNLQLRKTGFSYDIFTIVDTVKKTFNGKPLPTDFLFKFHRVDIEIVGINSSVEIEGIDPCNEHFNYYNIANPVSNVKQFMRVLYKNAYKNVDIEFYASEKGTIKYNFIVRPGGKIEDIKLKFDGGKDDFVTKLVNGKIEIQTSLGKLNESIPESWVINEVIKQVFVGYRLVEKNTFGFTLNEPYPSNSTLIIDPLTTRSWATYYGGALHDGGVYGSRFVHDIALDAAGDIYFTASTASSNQIATTGAFQVDISTGTDAFIVKFNCDGTRGWGTYYGGPGSDYGHNLATDGSFLYVVGTTSSTSNISTPGSYQTTNGGGAEDLFLVKFDYNGNRIWATYYGGVQWDYGADIAVSPCGDLYIAGGTNSTSGISTAGSHQPTFGGTWDTFIAKFTTAGTRVWGTYYGGSGTEAWWSTRLATDDACNVYVATDVWGDTPVIASSGAQQPSYGGGSSDAFLAKFNSSGVRIWGTFYGGGGNETFGFHEPFGIKIDAAQNVYFFGTTGSTNNISTPGASQPALAGGNDVFLAKFNSAGLRQWGTYYGGLGDESGYGLDLDFAGRIYVSGFTASTTGIGTVGSYNASFNGGAADGFFTKFSNNGDLLSGSYYGGPGTDRVNCILTDGVTQLYLFGETDSPSNISTPGSFQPVFGGGDADAFLVKFLDIDNVNISGPDSVCTDTIYNYKTILTNSTSVSYNWTFPSGTTISSGQGTNSINVIWGANFGPVIVEVTYPGLCTSIFDTLQIKPSCSCNKMLLTSLQTNDTCNAGSLGIAKVNVSGGTSPYSYIWSPPLGSGQTTQIATDLTTGIYNVKVTDANGCKDSSTVTINIHPVVTARTDTSLCLGKSVILTSSGTSSYSWSPATGLNITTGAIVTSTPLSTTTYYVTGTDSQNCLSKDSVKIIVNPKPDVAFSSSDTIGCEPLCINFQDMSTIATGNNQYWQWNAGDGTGVSNTQNFQHCFKNDSVFSTVKYSVSLLVTSDSGCVTKLAKNNYITVFPKPVANFTLDPAIASIINPVISFSNHSTGADAWNWNFANTASSSLFNPPSRLYADTGSYLITLIVSSQCSCNDTAYQTITIEPDFLFYIPNSFTPNGDGINDTFTGKGISVIEFEMLIFDRWGKQVYKTTAINQPWDGRAKKGNELAENGVYLYVITVIDTKGKKHRYKDIVTLVR